MGISSRFFHIRGVGRYVRQDDRLCEMLGGISGRGKMSRPFGLPIPIFFTLELRAFLGNTIEACFAIFSLACSAICIIRASHVRTVLSKRLRHTG